VRPGTLLLALPLLLAGCESAPRLPHHVSTTVASADRVSTPHGAPAYCALEDRTTLARAAIPDVPRWFFKPVPEGSLVAYLGDDGNRLLDLDTGLLVPIPGERDAVPTPDARFVSVPGIGLFALSELLDEAGREQALELEAPLAGVYQSPGLLAESADEVIYRFMVDDEGPTIRDFRVTDTPAGPRIEPLGAKRRLCRGRHLQLPMLAPSGREFGAYDVGARSTRLLRIEPNGECSVLLDVGIPTGKVSFSFDGRYVAFHLAHKTTYTLKAGAVPEDRYVHSVFVLDRATETPGRLTHTTASNASYPAFRKDGTLVYLFKPYEESGGRVSFVVADPSRIGRWTPLAWARGECRAGDADCLRSLALGGLWARACSAHGDQLSAAAAALYALSLEREPCTRLVREHWDAAGEAVTADLRVWAGGERPVTLDAETLAAACP